MKPRVILLDALGTLLALEDPSPALVRELEARHGVTVTTDEARLALRAEMAFYRVHHDEASDLQALARLRRRCAVVLRDALPARAHGLPLDDVLAALLAALRFTPYPEVPATLDALRAEGIALVVVSNWDVSLHEVLAQTGLAERLDGVLTSAEVGFAKPGPEIFALALELVGATPDEALHVGDSAAEDVEGARAAGVRPVLLIRDPADRRPIPGAGDPGGSALEGVATVRSLSELPALAT
ncbi:MAG: putative hydrolase of the superfamily [Solirubrobacteraceae bacterium]|nr:putative hydrolase of the superfamily [Solirubrobacteraceae bacterium]